MSLCMISLRAYKDENPKSHSKLDSGELMSDVANVFCGET